MTNETLQRALDLRQSIEYSRKDVELLDKAIPSELRIEIYDGYSHPIHTLNETEKSMVLTIVKGMVTGRFLARQKEMEAL